MRKPDELPGLMEFIVSQETDVHPTIRETDGNLQLCWAHMAEIHILQVRVGYSWSGKAGQVSTRWGLRRRRGLGRAFLAACREPGGKVRKGGERGTGRPAEGR